ncbi:CmpA/NrtA family ABC transporter substrate-binding protein [Methylomicrobium sp. Wu6]|uniref:CmpA/NrtA family ABC transporter substrate-binding protein n=1 Tax=Methylomicrobium sp. Wu6 TaxID=3107928 RepID=UPI002DD68FFD|nr:CmpA/NrtA family ABC transporter substrate-binding protein [Methylomicrobium sp. Wu6]MEC4747541.1 CmpA/NrtA family ABC transporter substrate-binding protein [Methylomicrobium sp. Wu6]
MKHGNFTLIQLVSTFSKAAAATALLFSASAGAVTENLETESVKLGFIKLTDMAPLAVAFEKGFFEDEGLSVQVEAQANWKVVLDRVLSGELDGAHMLAPLPLGAAIGYGTKGEIISAFTLTLNGDAITVSNDVWKEMKPKVPVKDGKPVHPVKADTLKPVLEKYKSAGKPFNMAMTFPVGTHNIKLRYWLAAGGINPGYYSPPQDTSGQINADALLSVTPPPQMPATMDSGTIVGYCVGEPWNQQAVFKGIGVPVISDYELMKNSAEKIFGVNKAWADKHPNTHKALIKALIRASMWLDAENNKNRNEGVEMLSQSHYVGADYAVIANSMNGTFEYEKGDKRALPDFNVFFRYNASYPYYSDAIWYLTQMRRWGQINEEKPDSWYMETAKKVYRPDIYMAAAKELIAEGKAKADDFPSDKETGIKPPSADFIDGVAFDATKPNDYLTKFPIGLKGKQKVVGGKIVEN